MIINRAPGRNVMANADVAEVPTYVCNTNSKSCSAPPRITFYDYEQVLYYTVHVLDTVQYTSVPLHVSVTVILKKKMLKKKGYCIRFFFFFTTVDTVRNTLVYLQKKTVRYSTVTQCNGFVQWPT